MLGPARLGARLEHSHVLADARCRFVANVDRATHVGDATDVELGGLAHRVAELLGQARLRRVRDRDVVSELGAAQGDREPVAGVGLGQRLDRVLGRDLPSEVDDLEVELMRERGREVALVQDAGVDQVLAETLPGTGLPCERFVELLRGQQLPVDEHLAEPLALLRGHRRARAGGRGSRIGNGRRSRLGDLGLELGAPLGELGFDLRDADGRGGRVLVEARFVLGVVVEPGRVLHRVDVLRELLARVLATLEQAHVSTRSRAR